VFDVVEKRMGRNGTIEEETAFYSTEIFQSARGSRLS